MCIICDFLDYGSKILQRFYNACMIFSQKYYSARAKQKNILFQFYFAKKL